MGNVKLLAVDQIIAYVYIQIKRNPFVKYRWIVKHLQKWKR